MTYSVLVGNVGTVITTEVYGEAIDCFNDYAELSKEGYGRIAGEPVTLFANDDVIKEL